MRHYADLAVATVTACGHPVGDLCFTASRTRSDLTCSTCRAVAPQGAEPWQPPVAVLTTGTPVRVHTPGWSLHGATGVVDLVVRETAPHRRYRVRLDASSEQRYYLRHELVTPSTGA